MIDLHTQTNFTHTHQLQIPNPRLSLMSDMSLYKEVTTVRVTDPVIYNNNVISLSLYIIVTIRSGSQAIIQLNHNYITVMSDKTTNLVLC